MNLWYITSRWLPFLTGRFIWWLGPGEWIYSMLQYHHAGWCKDFRWFQTILRLIYIYILWYIYMCVCVCDIYIRIIPKPCLSASTFQYVGACFYEHHCWWVEECECERVVTGKHAGICMYLRGNTASKRSKHSKMNTYEYIRPVDSSANVHLKREQIEYKKHGFLALHFLGLISRFIPIHPISSHFIPGDLGLEEFHIALPEQNVSNGEGSGGSP